MTTPSSQVFESYVPVYDAVPEKWEDARQFLVEHLKKISNAVNIREIGWFLDEELLSGKQFIPPSGISGSSQQYRTVFRKVIDFGTLPNATTKNVAHGITVDANFTLLNLYGAASDPVAFIYRPVPYATDIAANTIVLFMTATNVSIRTSIDYTAYTRCYVVIEYIKEL